MSTPEKSPMSLGTIVIASHHFTVTIESETVKRVVKYFVNPMIQQGLKKEGRRFVFGPIKTFAARDANKRTYRFHINQWEDFLHALRMYDVSLDRLTIYKRGEYEPFKCELPIFEQWIPRDYQEPIIEYITSGTPVSKFLELQTGFGKSFCAMSGMSITQDRALVLVKPMYIEKWLDDMKRTYDLPKEDYYVIQGTDSLLTAMQRQKEGTFNAKIIVASNRTMQIYIKLFEEKGKDILDLGYECLPEDFYEFFQIGFRLIDEVHQDWHLNYIFDLYTHVRSSLSLSATLLSTDEFIRRTYQIAYPMKDRYIHKEIDKYVNCIAYVYGLREPNKVRYSDPGSDTYSHNAYEDWIMKDDKRFQHYMDMLVHVINDTYVATYKPGNRLMVFASTKEMCTRMSSYLGLVFPQYSVKRFIAGDPFENLMEPDIRCATLIKAGTAVDVDKLQTTIMTNNVLSIQANVQAMGRTRKMKDGQEVAFVWFCCEDILKHKAYHTARSELARERAKSLEFRRYFTKI